MIKQFCDLCGVEIPEFKNRVTNRLKLVIDKVCAEIIVAVNDVRNDGHVCEACIRRVIAEGEEYVKPF